MNANLHNSMPCAVFGHNYFKPKDNNFNNIIECRCCGYSATQEQLLAVDLHYSKKKDFDILMRKLFSLQRKFKPRAFSSYYY